MSLIPINQTIIQTENSGVKYEPEFLTFEESEYLYEYFLHNLDWQHDKHRIYGKTIITKRKIAWFADAELNYNYSGTERIANGVWDEKVMMIKKRLEDHTGFTFNSCLLNLYHDGSEGMAWHGDDQNHLNPAHTTVAIISLGAERVFKLRETIPPKSKILTLQEGCCPPLEEVARSNGRTYKVILEKGSLLLMLDQTQKYWQHEIPKMAAIKTPRISLTWRTMAIK